jgi:Zn-dependent peptidase ImmA (M78 family)
MKRISVNINPIILKWARLEAGYNISEVAYKLPINNEIYQNWEIEGKNIPLGKLKDLARYYRRQIAVFFLQNVPDEIKKPKDFRNLSPEQSKLSKDVLLILRRVNRLQKIAFELKDKGYWEKRYHWINEFKKNEPHDLAKWIRNKLEVNINKQLSWKKDYEAYRNWRIQVEDKLGILIFQFSMPLEEVNGFCLTNNFPYVIITNSNHPYTGRIFTIFHELIHILRHESGMCLIDNINKNQKDEWECNALAAEILIPVNTLIQTDSLDEIKKYASELNVSREAYLRKLKEENLISDIKFFSILDEIRSTYKKRKSKDGFVLPEVRSKASRGETFFNMVLEAVTNNQINYSEASNALDLRINRLLNEL